MISQLDIIGASKGFVRYRFLCMMAFVLAGLWGLLPAGRQELGFTWGYSLVDFPRKSGHPKDELSKGCSRG